ncbi:beta-ketoacyl-[acyl-carrier-protein] synthase family protein [Colwellia sp. KU-HH00111]|uniref:beta-ketoacyl-[acyl-carrier-protein] synthase family protein n=1 Tax=Colwellia sp. KU-HH00111 TaxID=3127652 RepID=UPI0031044B63
MTDTIVVTGLGCISAAGNDVAEFESTLFNPELVSSIAPTNIIKPDENIPFLAAQVNNYNGSDYFPKKEIKLLDRYAQFAMISAEQAVKDANLVFDTTNKHRTSVVHGTSIGGQETIEHSYYELYSQGKSRAHPFTVPKLLPSSASASISMKYGITGPTFTTASACSSSGHAIAMAALMLRSNLIDHAIVGGAEACITKGNFYAWNGLRVLSNDTCRPFAQNRSGLVIGEGAATLILERESSAKARNATIYAKLAGIGMSSDAHNIVQPLTEGAILAMEAAIKDANISTTDIAYVNAHGSGTMQNDLSESQAILAVFNPELCSPLVSSTKAAHGHLLGAGAALEAIAVILALKKQAVPATFNVLNKDPLCAINLVTKNNTKAEVNYAMSNSFAFGGLNTTLIFQK